jgi:hypothetical protein
MFEEARAREREERKREEELRFTKHTRMFLLKRMQEFEQAKEKENEETAEKIKKLLADTIEFS